MLSLKFYFKGKSEDISDEEILKDVKIFYKNYKSSIENFILCSADYASYFRHSLEIAGQSEININSLKEDTNGNKYVEFVFNTEPDIDEDDDLDFSDLYDVFDIDSFDECLNNYIVKADFNNSYIDKVERYFC